MPTAEPNHPVCCLALELSRSKWLVGVLLPGSNKVTTHPITGGDVPALLTLLDRVRIRGEAVVGGPVALHVGYEAGYDGFWLARLLIARGIPTTVLDPTSFLVRRRGRRAKTDRIDVEAMAFTLRAHLAGDQAVCRAVRIPSPDEEDAKRLTRERTHLTGERTRHVNRIRGLLNLHGIREVKGLWGGAWREWLSTLTTGDGRPLGLHLARELARQFERLHLVMQQIKELDDERQRALEQQTSAFPAREKVGRLIKLAGVGEISATLLVTEVYHRSFANRRHLASYLGLAPSPFASGEVQRDQGISKAGNRAARRLLIELAWCWLRYQPGSQLACWYREVFAKQGARSRKIGVVALARKLAIALWRFVEAGVVPDGAVLKAR